MLVKVTDVTVLQYYCKLTTYREDWVEELKKQEVIQVCKVKDLFNLADMLTKCYATYKFKSRIKQVQECKNLQIAD